MTLSVNGLERIKRYESCSLVVYDDQAGRPTIGWGHLIRKGEDFSAGLTELQADHLLKADLKPRIEAVQSMLEVEVTQDQFDSCVSLLFNIGEEAFRRSTFLRAVNGQCSNADVVLALIKWDKVRNPNTGRLEVSPGLRRRRIDESRAWPL